MSLLIRICTTALTLFLYSCNAQTEKQVSTRHSATVSNQKPLFTINENGKTIQARFQVGFAIKKDVYQPQSFAHFLSTLPLKPQSAPVLLYNGEQKWNQDVHAAVIDLPIGKRDLHQCADGIMHLKALYHYNRQEYNQIGFHFVNGFYCDYDHWKKGYRVRIKGNHTYWYKSTSPDSSINVFYQYLEMVYSYAGTLSLSKELVKKELSTLSTGDVFIQGGSPGHAIIVINKASNATTGERYFLLAQSYMPAQELHILKNYVQPDISPWYSMTQINEMLSTPEWNFYPEDLKAFD